MPVPVRTDLDDSIHQVLVPEVEKVDGGIVLTAHGTEDFPSPGFAGEEILIAALAADVEDVGRGGNGSQEQGRDSERGGSKDLHPTNEEAGSRMRRSGGRRSRTLTEPGYVLGCDVQAQPLEPDPAAIHRAGPWA